MGNQLASEIIKKEVMRCNRCGLCQDACPTYRATGEEMAVARGRNRMLRMAVDGQIEFEKEPAVFKMVDACLLCKSCVVNCPSNVATDKIMLAARSAWCRSHGLSLLQRMLYRGVFSHSNRTRFLNKLARFYQKSGTRWLVRKSGLAGASQGLRAAEAMLPAEISPNVRQVLLEKPLAKGTGPQVTYFLGCAVENLVGNIGLATLDLLEALHCQVTIPDTNCCGAPHHNSGDQEEAVRLALKNVSLLVEKTSGPIITDCATCSNSLKEYPQWLAAPAESSAQVMALRVKDVTSWLAEQGLSTEKLAPLPITVTYHDPCHLVRGLKVKEAPRKVLGFIPGLRLVEMKEADMCCGGAGSFSITHPELSRQVLKRKINNIMQTGAEAVVTSCPACTMQLTYGLKLFGLPLPVLHPVQLAIFSLFLAGGLVQPRTNLGALSKLVPTLGSVG
ncbi:MAG: (Fe-S)-binding protein [Bacillota bacterium]